MINIRLNSHYKKYVSFNCVKEVIFHAKNKFLVFYWTLVFHDCAGDASCNGCINLVAGNEGLQGTVEFLDTLYLPKYTTVLSRADFWQIAGIVAINAAVELNNKASATNPRIP